MAYKRTSRSVGSMTLVGILALATSACSSSGSSSSPNGSHAATGSALPAEIDVPVIRGTSGSLGYFGTDLNDGTQLAIDQINAQHFLGNSVIKPTFLDDANDPTTSASKLTEAIANTKYAAVLGPGLSNAAVADSAIAQANKMPIVYAANAGDGVVIGAYTFRATAPQQTYYSLVGKYLQSKSVKTVGVISNVSNPALVEIATNILPALGSTDGFTILSSVSVQATTTDFSVVVSKIVSAHPDAVDVLVLGAQNPEAMIALRQAGYNGVIVGQTGAGAGALLPAGSAGAGMVWATDYSEQSTDPSMQAFTKAFQAKYNKTPVNYDANGYDAAWMLARAIKAAGKYDRASVQQGLVDVAKTGFAGATGNITFSDNDARVPGVLVQWNGKDAVEIPTP
jgi:branched-chain amino acid transport system substrate-binding protein